jgi:hypothetical protein
MLRETDTLTVANGTSRLVLEKLDLLTVANKEYPDSYHAQRNSTFSLLPTEYSDSSHALRNSKFSLLLMEHTDSSFIQRNLTTLLLLTGNVNARRDNGVLDRPGHIPARYGGTEQYQRITGRRAVGVR